MVVCSVVHIATFQHGIGVQDRNMLICRRKGALNVASIDHPLACCVLPDVYCSFASLIGLVWGSVGSCNDSVRNVKNRRLSPSSWRKLISSHNQSCWVLACAEDICRCQSDGDRLIPKKKTYKYVATRSNWSKLMNSGASTTQPLLDDGSNTGLQSRTRVRHTNNLHEGRSRSVHLPLPVQIEALLAAFSPPVATAEAKSNHETLFICYG